MDVNGVLVKAWVYNKTLFYLIKIKGENVPVVLSSRDLDKFQMRKDGSVKGIVDYNKFKLAKGSSKQYFGNKEAMAETSKSKHFDEYDPDNEMSFMESPDEDMELLGYETIVQDLPPSAGGVDPIYESPDILPPEPDPVGVFMLSSSPPPGTYESKIRELLDDF